jgi:hypothetical protein
MAQAWHRKRQRRHKTIEMAASAWHRNENIGISNGGDIGKKPWRCGMAAMTAARNRRR